MKPNPRIAWLALGTAGATCAALGSALTLGVLGEMPWMLYLLLVAFALGYLAEEFARTAMDHEEDDAP